MTDEIKPSTDVKLPSPPRKDIYCGLVWPEKGFPAYLCVVREKQIERDKMFDVPAGSFEIYQEGAAKTFSELMDLVKEVPKKYCRDIFTLTEPRFASYIRDFNRWKRDNLMEFRLRESPVSTFEAGMLKI